MFLFVFKMLIFYRLCINLINITQFNLSQILILIYLWSKCFSLNKKEDFRFRNKIKLKNVILIILTKN